MQQPGLFGHDTFSISEVTRVIQAVLESEPLLQDVWVKGEISNLKYHTSGHVYLTLKDDLASLRCIIWKMYASRLRGKLQDGMSITAHGRISVYERNGDYQLYIDNVQLAGEGLLFQEFMRLKAKLEEEGLFDPARKRPLPEQPRTIGIITSSTGAALQDMLNILRQRYPLAEVFLAPAAVQGTIAPLEIVAQLRMLNQMPVDVIIIARGGGSIEDLWAFNDERVVRAIAESPVPVVTGIGHETDFTLADFVADVRAPTPTAAAVQVTPDIIEIRTDLLSIQTELENAITNAIAAHRTDLREAGHRLERSTPINRIQNERQHIDTQQEKAIRLMLHFIQLQRSKVSGKSQHLASVSPIAVLQRGYALVMTTEGKLVSSVQQIQPMDWVDVKIKDGSFTSIVQEVKPADDLN
jgi:exodeoxyribonuclease VII large subunit